MIRRIFAAGLGAVLLAVPVLASADAQTDLMDQARFLLTREAASRVNFDSSKSSCVVMTSVETARVGEAFLFAWGSFGIDTTPGKNGWTQNGAYNIVTSVPGTYLYKLSFVGARGAATSCETRVVVR